METTTQIINGQVITTSITTIDVATYINQLEAENTQYQNNIDALQHQIDIYTQKVLDTQALIDQAS